MTDNQIISATGAASSLGDSIDEGKPNDGTSEDNEGVEKRRKVKSKYPTWLADLLGFRLEKLTTWDDLTRLLHRPCDPASLAITRILFGLLMLLDLPQERGMGYADEIWGNPSLCHFPLFNGLHPLPLRWMIVLYGVMVACAILMTFGLKWRLSCGIFLVSYWYIFLLDKSVWNNHSYLYGLLTLIMFFSDPHRCWSLDGLKNPEVKDSHVPLWSYALLRIQVFLLYFFAGVKKVDSDWLFGYSMQRLSEHWVFSPFRFIMSNESIDYFLIHLGGFVLDFTIGFLLFFDVTRKPALIFGMAFHLMNSQIFSIGMFPWVCMATMPLFCSFSWPRNFTSLVKCIQIGIVFAKAPLKVLVSIMSHLKDKTTSSMKGNSGINKKKSSPEKANSSINHTKSSTEKVNSSINKNKSSTEKANSSRKKIDTKDKEDTRDQNSLFSQDSLHDQEVASNETSDEEELPANKTSRRDKRNDPKTLLQRNTNCCYEEDCSISKKQRTTTLLVLLYISLQLFLPFSHFITKGYNTWTEGPYGYSWDMMVHSWNTLNIKIMVVQKDTQEKMYLDPNVWVRNNRWASHVDMAAQYGSCIKDRLTDLSLSNFSLHFDVWRSLNGRFHQRVYDPTVNILEAPWSPWQKTPWVLPMLTDLSPWRSRLYDLEQQYHKSSSAADVLFIADFPGLILDNFISEHLSNITLEVLQGEVAVILQIPLETNECQDLTETSQNLKDNFMKFKNPQRTFHQSDRDDTSSASFENKKSSLIYNVTLRKGDKIHLPNKSLHKVLTTSSKPSSYMYAFMNSTLQGMIEQSGQEENMFTTKDDTNSNLIRARNTQGRCRKEMLWFLNHYRTKSKDPTNSMDKGSYDKKLCKSTNEQEQSPELPRWKDFVNFIKWKSHIFYRSGKLFLLAVKSIVNREPISLD